MFFVDRALYQLKKHFLTLVTLCIIWNSQIQVSKNMSNIFNLEISCPWNEMISQYKWSEIVAIVHLVYKEELEALVWAEHLHNVFRNLQGLVLHGQRVHGCRREVRVGRWQVVREAARGRGARRRGWFPWQLRGQVLVRVVHTWVPAGKVYTSVIHAMFYENWSAFLFFYNLFWNKYWILWCYNGQQGSLTHGLSACWELTDRRIMKIMFILFSKYCQGCRILFKVCHEYFIHILILQ